MALQYNKFLKKKNKEQNNNDSIVDSTSIHENLEKQTQQQCHFNLVIFAIYLQL